MRIYSGTDVHRILDELDEAIGKNDLRIFQRTGHLAIVRGILAEDAKRLRIAFSPDELILAPLKRENLLPSVSEYVDYGSEVVSEHGSAWKRQIPTNDITSAFLSKRFWAHIRPIRSVSKTPVMHLDGTLTEDGYDASTRTLVASNVTVDAIEPEVSKEQAAQALDDLIEPFKEFHFASDVHRYAPAALILTLLLRPSIAGNVPLFIFRAPQKDCGKSLVAKVSCVIATGSVPAANTWSSEKEEQEKVLCAVATAGLSACFFDNVSTGSVIGGGPLDKVATCDGEVAFRVLGHTEHRTLPWSTVIVFTSNRARIEGDTDRRSVVAELTRREEPLERFEHEDIIAYAKDERSRLLAAAFTLIRGWVQAGSPVEGVARLSSFELWSRTVPSIIKWATSGTIDVRTLVPDAEGTDADEVEFKLLETMHAYLGAYNLNATTVKAMLGRVFADVTQGQTQVQGEARTDLRDAIDALECTTGRGEHQTFDKRKFGKKLASMVDVFYAPYRLVKAGREDGLIRWNVTRATSPTAPYTNGAISHTEVSAPVDEREYIDDILR
jgi:hypothetical protein